MTARLFKTSKIIGVLPRIVAGFATPHDRPSRMADPRARLVAERKRILVLLWNNAFWHISRQVRTWIRAHN
jgi:hypothetical protein